MQKFWAQLFKYALTSKIIEKIPIAIFLFGTSAVLLICIFLLHPILIDDDSEKTINNIYSIYVFINIMGNYFLAIRSDNNYKTGNSCKQCFFKEVNESPLLCFDGPSQILKYLCKLGPSLHICLFSKLWKKTQ